MEVVCTKAGFARGFRKSPPLILGLAPFGVVVGIVTAQHGLSIIDCVVMNAVVYAGASQLVAFANWSTPAPILAAAFAAFVVNLRLALMAPVLAPWLDGIGRWRRLLALALLVDHPWALSITDMRKGGTDAAFYMGLAVPLWGSWLTTTTIGYLGAAHFALPAGHPIFFAAVAAFIALLVPLWRNRRDGLPWLIASVVSVITAHLIPHTSWYIATGALAGATVGAMLDRAHDHP
jgi:branched chain amino acid efflux pump